MERFIIFGVFSVPVIILSWRTLSDFQSHGFYRFFSWECILWLLASNARFWFDNPLGYRQILSWILLLISAWLVIAGVIMLRKAKNPGIKREDPSLYQFEKTSDLIDTGIYKYIRHPLYSSLLFLTWGIYLKNTSDSLLVIAFLSSAFLYLTAVYDEKECIRFFGERYRMYMKRSKRFIPFIV